MVKVAIFDLDGTLTDTLESMAVAGNRTLESVGLEPRPIEEYKLHVGDGAAKLVERILIAAGDTELKKYKEAYRAYMDEFALDCTYKVKVYDGIMEMLKEIKSKGIKVAVLSNKPHQRVLQVVYKFFGESMFSIVWGEMPGFVRKPDPLAAISIAHLLGAEPDDVMYVGDTDVDMQTSVAAGMRTVGALWGFREEDELRANGAEVVVSHPSELVDLVDTL